MHKISLAPVLSATLQPRFLLNHSISLDLLESAALLARRWTWFLVSRKAQPEHAK